MWYKTGTVQCALNSGAVTGTGTLFAANCRVGDGFLGPDGRWYEITNVASNTVLAISPNYLGANVAVGTYAIAPIQGYNRDSALALRSLTNQFSNQLAALKTTGNYDILPLDKGGTGVVAATAAALLSSLGAMPVGGVLAPVYFNSARFASGASYSLGQGAYIGWNDSNDGSGFNGHTAFTTNRGGGVGGFTWRSVNLDNTVGGPTMSYSFAGVLNVPVGITLNGRNIVQSGSNSNGFWIRYADGTQECWTAGFGFGPTNANQNISTSWTPPVAFTSGGVTVIATLQYAETNDNFTIARLNANMGANGTVAVTCNASVSQVYRIGLHAIGKWY